MAIIGISHYEETKMRIFQILVVAGLFAVVALMPATARANDEVLRDGWMVQSSAKVTGGGEQVSQEAFDTTGWYKTPVPNTVFAVQVENGVYKNPYFGMNLRSVPGVEYAIGTEYSNQDMLQTAHTQCPGGIARSSKFPNSLKGKRYGSDSAESTTAGKSG